MIIGKANTKKDYQEKGKYYVICALVCKNTKVISSMTVNTSDKDSSLSKGQLSKKLLVKDRLLSKITFTKNTNNQRPDHQADILMVKQQSELIMVKEPDKSNSGELAN